MSRESHNKNSGQYKIGNGRTYIYTIVDQNEDKVEAPAPRTRSHSYKMIYTNAMNMRHVDKNRVWIESEPSTNGSFFSIQNSLTSVDEKTKSTSVYTNAFRGLTFGCVETFEFRYIFP